MYKDKLIQLSYILVGALLTATMIGSAAHARSSFLGTWQDLYPASQTDDNVINGTGKSCMLCHDTSSGGGSWNGYGWEMKVLMDSGLALTDAIVAAEPVNSDTDTGNNSNLVEINANTQPGWTTGINMVFFKDGTTGTTAEPTNVGQLDPGVGNIPPTADPNGPYTGTAGIAVNFDGTASADTDGTIVAYAWDFGDGNTGTGVTPSHAYAASGTYTVSLMVTDDGGATDTATTTADISPAANISPTSDPNGPYTGTAGTVVLFDGSGSADTDGTIIAYEWTFGDNSTGTGVTPSHSYSRCGSYNVSLTVTDNNGASDTAGTTADIASTGVDAPTANANGPYNGIEGQSVQFDGTASSDPDCDIVAYAWDYGDGNTGTGATPTHTYAAAGNYTVTLVVTDNDNLTGMDTTTAAISPVAQPIAPIADANGPYTGTEGMPVQFDGTGSSDPDGSIVSYMWDFGDGTTGSGITPAHTYAAAGNYAVSLTVVDNDNLSGTDTTSASIQAAVFDLDIAAFRTSKRLRLSSNQPAVSLKLVVKNNSAVMGTTTATVVGRQGANTLATFTAEVSDAVGNGRSTFTFTYTPGATVVPGIIDWTASFNDGDPDIDEATATTLVVE